MVYIITGIFILLDIVTGVIKAFKEKNYTSTVMREGLYHKAGSILCLVFGGVVDYSQGYFDIGVNIPVVEAICVYIVMMEIGSIIENICTINPQIMPEKLQSFFSKLKK